MAGLLLYPTASSPLLGSGKLSALASYFLVSPELSHSLEGTGYTRTSRGQEEETSSLHPSSSLHLQPHPFPSAQSLPPLPPQQYLRLTGKGHAKDGDTAENALPADVADPLQPLPTEEAMLKGRQHDLDQERMRHAGQRQCAALPMRYHAAKEGQGTSCCSSLHQSLLTPEAWGCLKGQGLHSSASLAPG